MLQLEVVVRQGGRTEALYSGLKAAAGDRELGGPAHTMSTRTITVHDRCTKCNRTLHFISEGERGVCGPCWVASLAPETKKAINRVIASAFNGSGEEEKSQAVDGAMKALQQEDKKPSAAG
ncbi:MAG: hypothetical protein E6G97_18150 [Alphaproteobacteria bacterium]|nr:MAG: hypothetical protein E6G97_18150 [Alphaproteobacteria bacterium]